MKVIGADACCDKLVLCCLESPPVDPREEFLDMEFIEVSTDTVGLQKLLRLKPDVVILEPTGVHYIKFWLYHLNEKGIEVRLVHNSRLPQHRAEILDIPDKDDEADAYALAIYYWMYCDNPKRWVTLRDPIVQQMRELVLKLGHNARIKTAVINRLHQVLRHEFPEMADATTDAPLFWGWIAGKRKSKRYDLMLKASKGLGISEATQFDAMTLYHYLIEDKRLERELQRLYLEDERFEPYRRVFKDFGFGLDCSSKILSQIFPIEDYLGPDGKPIVKISRGRYSKKPTKKYISLRRFKKALGDAPVREWSGKKKKSKRAGSQLCRTALFLWFKTRIEFARSNSALNSPRGKRYRLQFQAEVKKKRPRNKIRAELRHQVVKELFYELVNAITRL